MLAKTKTGVGRIRRNREGRSGRTTGRTAPELVVAAPSSAAKPRRREAGGLQDMAIYTCECGFVFHAPVSTSVGCPHCGSEQAW